jgi:trehalose-phosphatase
MTRSAELDGELRRFAHGAAQLIICDYDGVLAPLVDEPDQAFANERSIDALVALAALPDTHVAVVSGRSVGVLEALCSFPAVIRLVGSHGSEYRDGPGFELDPAQIALLAQIADRFRQLAAHDRGFIVESKPFSVAFHYRMADPALAERAVAAIERGPASWPEVKVKTGKKVFELAVIAADKGTAVEQLRHQLGAKTVLFVGDDITDEDAFAVLGVGDVGIKVGPGQTLAEHRLVDTDDVAALLSNLLELRRST